MFKLLNIVIFFTILTLSYCAVAYYPPYPNFGCIQPNYNINGTHSVFIGCVKPTDRLLYNQHFYKSGSIFGTRQSIIRYPLPGYVRNETISGIWMFDYDRKATGGYGRISSGGVGNRNVTIEIRSSSWGKGFNYLIQIYGV